MPTMRLIYPLIFTVLMIGSLSCTEKKDLLPNIVFIMADDMGYGDLTCLNPESKVPTPNMDRIAQNGMVFTDAHSPSAVCTPTRYGVLTGRYCFRSRLKSGVLVGHSKSLIESGRMTVASVLGESGYYTACIGKWHLGLDWPKVDENKELIEGGEWAPTSTSNIDYNGVISGGPTDHGFDYSFIIPASLDMTPYCYISNKRLIAPIDGFTEGKDTPRGVFWRQGDLQKDFRIEEVLPRITREAVSFINTRKNETDPFFLYFPLTAPHTPWLPSQEFEGKSGAGIYGDFVNMVDHTVGEVLNALQFNNLWDNTLLIVTSDNGAHWTPSDQALFPHLANGSFSGMKSDAWEGGHHVPFILQWPSKVKRGTLSNQLLTLTDLMATCAEICNFTLPVATGEDSFSFLSAITAEESDSSVRTSAIHHSISGMFAIRMGEFKYIDGKGSGGWSYAGSENEPPGQLYNIKSDPKELNNLYNEMPEMVEKLSRELNRIKLQGYSH